MPGTKRWMALSDEELGRLLSLLKGADSVELKLTVPDGDYRSAGTDASWGSSTWRRWEPTQVPPTGPRPLSGPLGAWRPRGSPVARRSVDQPASARSSSTIVARPSRTMTAATT
jgi:hypothetical protein